MEKKIFFKGSDYETRGAAIYIDSETDEIYIDEERVNPRGVIAYFGNGWHVGGAKING